MGKVRGGTHKPSQYLLPEPKEPQLLSLELVDIINNLSVPSSRNPMHLQASLGKTQPDTAKFIQCCTGRRCSNPEDTWAALPIGYLTPLRSRTLGQQRLSVMKPREPPLFEERIAFSLNQSSSRQYPAQYPVRTLKLLAGVIGVILTSLEKGCKRKILRKEVECR